MSSRHQAGTSRRVALAAVWGMILASAGLTGDIRCVADTCCAADAEACDDCCSTPSVSDLGSRSAYTPSPCQCRSSEPAAPVPKSNSPASVLAWGLPVSGPGLALAPHVAIPSASAATCRLDCRLPFLTTHLRC